MQPLILKQASMIQTTENSPVLLRWVPVPQPVILPPPSEIVTRRVDGVGWFPCRRCLSDGKPGEVMNLISYNPFPADAKNSPYQGLTAIFLHARNCVKYSSTEMSEQQRLKLLDVRAFDAKHMLVNFATLQGEGLVQKAGEMLADEKVDYLHVHYVGPGCFAVRIERNQV